MGVDETIIAKQSIGEMGYIALAIEMQFLPQKVTKGQAVADFLAKHSNPRTIKLHEDSQMRLLKFV